MLVDGQAMRSICLADDGWAVEIIDQTQLPHRLVMARLESLQDAARAIAEMLVRGAPLIGATAAYGLALAMRKDPCDAALSAARDCLLATRPTAVNLRWALESLGDRLAALAPEARAAAAYAGAAEIADEDVAINEAIGRHGLPLIESAAAALAQGETVNILTL